MGNTSKRYSAEVRERAVRLFQEHVHEYPTRWEGMVSIAAKIVPIAPSTYYEHKSRQVGPTRLPARVQRGAFRFHPSNLGG
jgi:hypothetical protein